MLSQSYLKAEKEKIFYQQHKKCTLKRGEDLCNGKVRTFENLLYKSNKKQWEKFVNINSSELWKLTNAFNNPRNICLFQGKNVKSQ